MTIQERGNPGFILGLRHPAPEEVSELCTRGYRVMLKYSEELIAGVTLKPETDSVSPEDLQAFCKGKIAHHKIPRNFKFVGDHLMTVIRKIQKFKMQEISIEEMGLTK